jgi:hypothetical protein
MALSVKQKTKYINIKEGKLYSEGKPFDTLEARLERIRLQDREFRGEVIKYWYFDLVGAKAERYSLGIHYRSGVARSLINTLASVQDFSKPVTITPYQSGDYTKVMVEQRGEKLSWLKPELPPVQTVTLPSGELTKDDSNRVNFFRDLADDINSRIPNLPVNIENRVI